MSTLALQAAGILAILAAIGHGYLGDRTLRAQPIADEHLKLFIRYCYQFGSLAWLIGGILFLTMPPELPASVQIWLVLIITPLYALGAVVNAWFTRGRHFGWVLLAAVVILSITAVT